MEPQTLTIEQVKVFTLSPSVVRLIAEIKTARLKEARVKAHVAGYIEPAFSAFEPFRRSLSPRDPRNGERITSTKDLYFAGREQDEQRARWYAHCDQLHVQHGYVGLAPGQCPALVAEVSRIDAENRLLRLLEVAFKWRPIVSSELRAKALAIFIN